MVSGATFRSFTQLPEFQQRIVVLKSQGLHHQNIAKRVAHEFGVSCSKNTINQYFAAGGTLEQALSEYNAMTADEWLREARTQAKLYSKVAIETLAELIEPRYPPMVRLNAAKALANKYLPDGQKDNDHERRDEGLPDHVREVLNTLLNAPNVVNATLT